MAQDDIQGQVVDPSGNPVSGAIVELTKSFESNPVEEQTVLRTTTDSNGNYIFEFHPDGDGTTQDYHVSCYNHDGTAYVNSFNNPGVTADLPEVAIPDSGNLHARYDFGEEDGTMPISDRTGNGHNLSNGSYSGVSGSINGNQAGEFDGADDNPHSNTFTTVSQPFTVSAVVELGSVVNKFERWMSFNSSAGGALGYLRDTHWDNFAGSVLLGSSDKSVQLLTIVVDGANSVHREDGIEIATGDIGDNDMDVVALGHRRDSNSQIWSGKIGEVLIYPDRRTSSEIGDIESYLSNEWGVSI